MESLAAVLPELKKGWWGATPDLKDAYLHIAIDPSDKKWLGFCIDGQTYRFKSLPFRLSTAHRTFTRIVKVVAEHLRRKGFYVFVYLDDWLLTALSTHVLRRRILITKRLVHSLGFIINEEKSAPEPTQCTQFLGALLDFKAGKAFPTWEGPDRHRMRQAHHERTSSSGPSLDASAGANSKPHSNPSSVPSMHIVIQLHIFSKYRSHNHPLSFRIPVTNRVKKAVLWWTQPANIQPGRQFPPPPT